jgi:hypothetical protein
MFQRQARGASLTPAGDPGDVFTSNGDYGEWVEPDTAALEAAIALKANAANPVFTGTVTVPDGALAIADTNGLQSALDLKANSASPTLSNPTFTGTVTVPDNALAIADTNGLQTALDAKAPIASPTFTGTVTTDAVTATGDLKITQNGQTAFLVEGDDGVDSFRVDNQFHESGVPSGGFFTLWSDAYVAKTIELLGASGNARFGGSVEIDGALNHDGTTVGF